jgi:hypothetical protein
VELHLGSFTEIEEELGELLFTFYFFIFKNKTENNYSLKPITCSLSALEPPWSLKPTLPIHVARNPLSNFTIPP